MMATLIRMLRDFDLAEEGLQEAYAAALFKAIDRMRRAKKFVNLEVNWGDAAVDAEESEERGNAEDAEERRGHGEVEEIVGRKILEGAASWGRESEEENAVEDDRLRLIF